MYVPNSYNLLISITIQFQLLIFFLNLEWHLVVLIAPATFNRSINHFIVRRHDRTHTHTREIQ